MSTHRPALHSWPVGQSAAAPVHLVGRHWPAAHFSPVAQVLPTQRTSTQALLTQAWPCTQVVEPQAADSHLPFTQTWLEVQVTVAQSVVTQVLPSLAQVSPARQAGPLWQEMGVQTLSTQVSPLPQVLPPHRQPVPPCEQSTHAPALQALPSGQLL
ncbi:MAG: hypothetical protein QM765_32105 [Myxococcales bacterium]